MDWESKHAGWSEREKVLEGASRDSIDTCMGIAPTYGGAARRRKGSDAALESLTTRGSNRAPGRAIEEDLTNELFAAPSPGEEAKSNPI
jgi:hypothetical protein